MASKFLDGSMIPRRVKRIFDQRGEERTAVPTEPAVLDHDGRSHAVRLVNISPSGAMVICPAIPHIGDPVGLQVRDRAAVPGRVLWVRNGRIGVGFDVPLDL